MGPAGPDQPHARGGYLPYTSMDRASNSSAPRTWGLSSLLSRNHKSTNISPTHVGVILCSIRRCVGFRDQPHARGGYLPPCQAPIRQSASAPRTWGLSYHAPNRYPNAKISPTHVGVIGCRPLRGTRRARPPHAHGGYYRGVPPSDGRLVLWLPNLKRHTCNVSKETVPQLPRPTLGIPGAPSLLRRKDPSKSVHELSPLPSAARPSHAQNDRACQRR